MIRNIIDLIMVKINYAKQTDSYGEHIIEKKCLEHFNSVDGT